MTVATARCRFLLCDRPAAEKVRVHGIYRGDTRVDREVPMCRTDARDSEEAVRRGLTLYLTPEEAVYVGPLERYIGRPKR